MKKILLIQLKRIGDLVLTTPAISALRQKFPDAKITLVVARECEPLIPAIEGIDRVLLVYRNASDITSAFAILRRKFDYCIDFTRNDRSAILAFLSRASKRIVSYRVKRRAVFRGKMYNEFVEHRMRDMHTVDYNLSLLEPLDIRGVVPPVHLKLPERSREKASALLQHSGLHGPFIVIHPGSARPEKFWEAARWAEVIRYLTEQRGLDVVLTGGTSRTEKNHLAEIKGGLPRPETSSTAGRVVDLSGTMDLLTLAALIERAQLMVTVDSAPLHLAGATATPQIALFGPTNPYHWHPRESATLILQGDSPKPVAEFVSRQARLPMKLISTEAVINAMNSLLPTPAK